MVLAALHICNIKSQYNQIKVGGLNIIKGHIKQLKMFLFTPCNVFSYIQSLRLCLIHLSSSLSSSCELSLHFLSAAAACKWPPDGKRHFRRILRERRGDLSSFQHKVLLIAWLHLRAQLTNSCKSIILLRDSGPPTLYILR